MLSSVLRSPRAVAVNVEIIRAFVRLRQLLATHAQLARKLDELEKKYDAQFRVVFDAIRQLMTPPEPKRRTIGFRSSREPESGAHASRLPHTSRRGGSASVRPRRARRQAPE